MPTARVLAIGDELLLGRTVDTNSPWLCRAVGEAGLAVARVTQVGDGQRAIEAALRQACRGVDLVVCTGGLGPTDDDRTRHALAAVAGVPLTESAAAWRQVRARIAALRPGRPIAASNRRQALLPRGARLLANDRGTAPGMALRIGSCWVACLPGVPHEMEAMATRLLRRLPRLIPGLRPPVVAELWFAGLGESAAQDLLAGLFSEAEPMVGITVSELGHITLRVVGTRAQVRARIAALRAPIAPWLLPRPGLAESLVGELAARGASVATAESCTCGHLAAAIGAVPGASAVWREGVVAYHADAKRRLLGVDPALVARAGVVSREVVEAMARGMRRRSGADLALATTGIAGPDGGTEAQPVGTVWLAAATAAGVLSREVRIPGSRARVQRRAAAAALQIGWEALRGGGPSRLGKNAAC